MNSVQFSETKEENSIETLVTVRDLSVEFLSEKGNVQAVNEINFSLHTSETLAILGESGSGKSTVALALMGLLPKPNSRINKGSINFKGKDLVRVKESERRKLRGAQMSMVFQDPLSALNPVFTVGFQIGEVLRTHKRISRNQVKKEVISLMRKVKIPDAEKRIKDYPHQFSGGMQQRIIIAIALALEPKFLIADEPTTALDVTVQNQIMHLLKDLQNTEEMGLVFISHDIGVVANYADKVAVMYAGHLIETGPVKEVLKNRAHPYTLGLISSLPTISSEPNRLAPINGSPPNMLNPPTGCPFHPRCPIAKEICKTEMPELTNIRNARKSACHFYEEVLDDESSERKR